MGSNLRRQLREALPAGIKGLQRAVALEIADDARYDDAGNYDPENGRRSKVRLAELVRWTAAKDELSVREMLRRLSLAGWEFRVPIGKDKNGNVMYAVPGKAMTFRVPDFEGPTTVGPYVETETVGPTTVGPTPNHGWAMDQPLLGVPPTTVGPGPTTVGPPSPVSSLSTKESPSSPVADATDGGGGDLSLEEITKEVERARLFVDSLPRPGKQPGKKQQQEEDQKLRQRVRSALQAGWSEDGLRRYLDISDDPTVRSAAALYLHRLQEDQLPDNEAPAALEGTDAVVNGWMELAQSLDGGRPSITDQRVHQALDAGRRMQARYDAGRQGYRGPATPNTAWERLEAEAASGAAPAGSEKYKHCGDPECDPITRRRDTDQGNGLMAATMCGRCHPAMRF